MFLSKPRNRCRPPQHRASSFKNLQSPVILLLFHVLDTPMQYCQVFTWSPHSTHRRSHKLITCPFPANTKRHRSLTAPHLVTAEPEASYSACCCLLLPACFLNRHASSVRECQDLACAPAPPKHKCLPPPPFSSLLFSTLCKYNPTLTFCNAR